MMKREQDSLGMDQDSGVVTIADVLAQTRTPGVRTVANLARIQAPTWQSPGERWTVHEVIDLTYPWGHNGATESLRGLTAWETQVTFGLGRVTSSPMLNAWNARLQRNVYAGLGPTLSRARARSLGASTLNVAAEVSVEDLGGLPTVRTVLDNYRVFVTRSPGTIQKQPDSLRLTDINKGEGVLPDPYDPTNPYMVASAPIPDYATAVQIQVPYASDKFHFEIIPLFIDAYGGFSSTAGMPFSINTMPYFRLPLPWSAVRLLLLYQVSGSENPDVIVPCEWELFL